MPKTAHLVMETFGFPHPSVVDPLFFTLQRRKEGVEVGLTQGGHWWSLSYLTEIYPATFAAARKWVAGYAARYGYEITQQPRRRQRR
jgi:hypothetical protein